MTFRLWRCFSSRVSINSNEKIWCRSVLKNYCWQQLQSWVIAIWGRIICSTLRSKLPLIWHHNLLLKSTLWKNMYMLENICSALYSKLPYTTYYIVIFFFWQIQSWNTPFRMNFFHCQAKHIKVHINLLLKMHLKKKTVEKYNFENNLLGSAQQITSSYIIIFSTNTRCLSAKP